MIQELMIKHWIDLLFLAFSAFVSWSYRSVSTRVKEERAITDAVAAGVQCLLRQEIVASYHLHVEDMGYCPLSDKEALSMAYAAYSSLHGNDVATSLYHRIMDLPTEPAEEER